jgi:hypothetical protein
MHTTASAITARTRRTIPTGVWYALAALGCALIIVVVQVVVFTSRVEPRDARMIVERELRMNTLVPGERVLRSVPVSRRSGADYFRLTRGLLVLTDRRLLYLGAAPRDVTGPADPAPTFDQREFPIDTLVVMSRAFPMLGFMRGLSLASPYGNLKVGVPGSAWAEAQALRKDWDARHRTLGEIGAWAQKVRDARKGLEGILAEFRKSPVYHVVRPGDAISSIAAWYEVTPDEIRQLNGIEGNKIKVGQRLLIRKGGS